MHVFFLLTPPVRPNILSRSGGVSISQSIIKSLKPGAYPSIVSNTGERERERERERAHYHKHTIVLIPN